MLILVCREFRSLNQGTRLHAKHTQLQSCYCRIGKAPVTSHPLIFLFFHQNRFPMKLPNSILGQSMHTPIFQKRRESNFLFILTCLSILLFSEQVIGQCDLPSGCSGILKAESPLQFYTICVGDSVDIELNVRFTSNNSIDTSVAVTLTLPGSLSGISIVDGDFTESGENSIDLEGTSGYISLSLRIGADTTVTPGDIISIPVTVGLPSGFCDQSDSVSSTIHLFVVDCLESTCNCNGSLDGIDLAGNLTLSKLIGGWVFGNPLDPQVPSCLSLNGTLIVDVPFF